jgi:phosphohistidine phosphatase
MRILFVRHAEAVEATEFDGRDLDRPLTPSGRKRFAKVAARLAQAYPVPDRIVCSKAARASETAEEIRRAFGKGKLEPREELNPGASPDDIRSILREKSDAEWVVIVGHEPDCSRAIASIVAQGKLRMKLKKGAVAEIDWPGRGPGTLRALWDPARV